MLHIQAASKCIRLGIDEIAMGVLSKYANRQAVKSGQQWAVDTISLMAQS